MCTKWPGTFDKASLGGTGLRCGREKQDKSRRIFSCIGEVVPFALAGGCGKTNRCCRIDID